MLLYYNPHLQFFFSSKNLIKIRLFDHKCRLLHKDMKKKLTEGHKTASDHLIECLNDHFVINLNWVT